MKIKFTRKGFSLPEVLLAVIILAVALTGILNFFIHCMILNEANRNFAIATTHAQYAMEEVKNANFANVISDFNGTYWSSSNFTSRGLDALTSENLTFTVTGSTQLNVTVNDTWRDRGNMPRNITMETSIAQP